MGLLDLFQITPGCGEFDFTGGELYIIAEKVFSPAGKTQARFSPPKVACLEVIRTLIIIISRSTTNDTSDNQKNNRINTDMEDHHTHKPKNT